MNDYSDYRRVEKHILQLAKRFELPGELWPDEPPPLGTMSEELAVIHLLGHLPKQIRRHPLAVQLLRSAVMAGGSHE